MNEQRTFLVNLRDGSGGAMAVPVMAETLADAFLCAEIIAAEEKAEIRYVAVAPGQHAPASSLSMVDSRKMLAALRNLVRSSGHLNWRERERLAAQAKIEV